MTADFPMENVKRSLTSMIQAVRWRPERGVETVSCSVAVEASLTIIVNDHEFATLLATPQSLRELTIGYLFTSGLIRSASQVLDWQFDSKKGYVKTRITPHPDFSSAMKRIPLAEHGTGVGNQSNEKGSLSDFCASSVRVDARTVVVAGKWITDCSTAFRESGGVHAAGLFDPAYGPLFYFEDVARHNAVDKAIGKALIENIDLSQLMLVRTGRISTEIVFKARQAGMAIMIARGAPTHQAIILAHDAGITLVGFAREDGFTVYCHPERIHL